MLYEPLNAFLTMQVGGRPVKLDVSREETFCNTRTRHSIEYDLTAGVDKDGYLLAKDMVAISNQGAYASHGHAIAANGLTSWRLQYACPNIRGKLYGLYQYTGRRCYAWIWSLRRYASALSASWMILRKKSGWIRWISGKKNLIHGYYEECFT